LAKVKPEFHYRTQEKYPLGAAQTPDSFDVNPLNPLFSERSVAYQDPSHRSFNYLAAPVSHHIRHPQLLHHAPIPVVTASDEDAISNHSSGNFVINQLRINDYQPPHLLSMTDQSQSQGGYQNHTRLIQLQPAVFDQQSVNQMTLLEYSRVTSSTPLGYSLTTPMGFASNLPENKN
jgi:hypothetical protein